MSRPALAGHRKYNASHLVIQAIGSWKPKCLPFFHALTGCDKSLLPSAMVNSAWEAWISWNPEASESFVQLSTAQEKPSTAF